MENVLILCSFSTKRSTIVGGGHSRSMMVTAREMSKKNNVTILQIGDFIPKFIVDQTRKFDIELISVDFPKFNPISILFYLKKIVQERNIDTIINFDYKLHGLASFAFPRVDLIQMKCGGPNPRSVLFPEARNIVCYSLEDRDWFRRHRPDSRIDVIANRSYDPPQDDHLIKEIARTGERVVLRICRIDEVYGWTVLQSAHLAAVLNHDIETQLIIVGHPKNLDYLRELEKQVRSIHGNSSFIIDERYTDEASKLIDIADVVVGTGRGFMEAAARGKILFSPQRDQEYPIFVREGNFERCFRTNFSGRSDFSESEIAEGLAESRRMLANPDSVNGYRGWIKGIFSQEFDAHSIPCRFETFARSAGRDRFSLKSLLTGLSLMYLFLLKSR